MRKILLLSFLGLFSMQANSQEIPEYCLENDVVHSYLTEVTYSPDNYQESKILNYCDNPPYNNKGVRKDQPKPVTINLSNALSEAATVSVSEYNDYSNALTMSVAKGAESITVWNLIPGRTYNWKVVKRDGTTVESGKFKTTGHLRMLKIDNIFNVRDLGGWTGLNGYALRYGAIIRGSRLNVNSSSERMLTAEGDAEMVRLGLRAELDMRDASNAVNASHAFFGSNYPIYNVNSAYNSRIATFADGPQSIEGVRKLIEWLKAGKPVYLHCSVGADRTGTVAFLVGALCGMSEDALSKEFELTSFSSDRVVNERDTPNYEVLIRQRNYTGRTDPNDNNESYKFAKMIDKIKTFPGETFQQKVYYHLSTGAKGPKESDGYLSNKVPTADLDWLIKYMLNPIEMNLSGTVNINKGSTKQLEVHLTSTSTENPNPVIAYTSSDTKIATVSESGLITAVGSGTATIKVSVDGYERSFSVKIPVVESELPDTIFSGDYYYSIKGNNYIKNGSFEYLNGFDKWKGGDGNNLSAEAFDLKKYDANSYNVYIESKGDGDESSSNSICTMWTLLKGRTYVFGYKVKNSTEKTTENNSNLVARMVTMNSDKTAVAKSQALEGNPTYSGEWTDVQYVFTNPKGEDGFANLQIVFTHLSEGGNNTCFDHFYLCELSEPTWVAPIQATTPMRMINDDKIYNLAGMEVTNPGKGIYIKNGKKYIVK